MVTRVHNHYPVLTLLFAGLLFVMAKVSLEDLEHSQREINKGTILEEVDTVEFLLARNIFYWKISANILKLVNCNREYLFSQYNKFSDVSRGKLNFSSNLSGSPNSSG